MKLGFYGCGNMGSAILNAVLQNNICTPNAVLVVGRDIQKLKVKSEKLNVHISLNSDDLQNCEYVILAFKPQALSDIKPIPETNQVIISILAGSEINSIQKIFKNKKVVRVMPNIPIQYGSGMTGLYFEKDVFTDEERYFVTSLFQSGGKTIELQEEKYFDSFTTLCGSGPAYFLYLAEQLTQIAVNNGYSTEQAHTMLRQTMIGAADMAKHTDLTLEELRNQITSPGGVTEAAIHSFENNNMIELCDKAIKSGIKRSEAL